MGKVGFHSFLFLVIRELAVPSQTPMPNAHTGKIEKHREKLSAHLG